MGSLNLERKQELKQKRNKLINDMEVLESSIGEIVTFKEFNVAQKSGSSEHDFKTIYIRQRDFRYGTLRIRRPCKLVLMEDIQFNPNRPGIDDETLSPNRRNDWLPHRSQRDYFSGDTRNAFSLGFFATITIEHKFGTIIDLNGYTLEMHPEFALQQRFHAIIELSDQPFIPKEGPFNFGTQLRSASNVWIKNGKIGLNCHHGIHGNDMSDILLTNLTFKDYEIAGISLNGGRRIVIEDCKLEGNRKEIPILGSYSAGRFIKLIGRNVARILPEEQTVVFKEKLDILEEELDRTFEEVIFGDGATNPLFKNETGIIYGNTYGITLHSKGVLINAFACGGPSLTNEVTKMLETTDIIFCNVSISNINSNIREILALAEVDGAPMHDMAGAIFQFFSVGNQPGNMTEDGYASLTALGAVQIELAKLLSENEILGGIKTTIPKEIIDWAQEDSGMYLKQDENNSRYFNLHDSEGILKTFELRSNGDAMHHVNKGLLGFFAQSVDGLLIEDLEVRNCNNQSALGSELAGNYFGAMDGGHAAQGEQIGYGGTNTRGIYIGACSNVSLDSCKSYNIKSDYGSAFGIDISCASDCIDMSYCLVSEVYAGDEVYMEDVRSPLPNLPVKGVGLRIDYDCEYITIENCKTRNIYQNSMGGILKEISSDTTTIK